MIFLRENEHRALERLYSKDINEAVVVYGNKENYIKDIVKEFIKDKEFFYFDALPISKELQVKRFYEDISCQINGKTILDLSYSSIFHALLEIKCEKRIIVINNFHNIVKTTPTFINDIISCLNDKWTNQKVLFLLVSENPYFVENQMVDKLNDTAYELSGVINIKDLPFIEFVKAFKNYSLIELVKLYAIVGGKNKYIDEFDSSKSFKQNVIDSVLDSNSYLFNKGKNLLPEELREPTVYNTLLYVIASGKEKLNDIHKVTGYSRPKISVYLNNLADFDLIERIDSFNTPGKENAMKGIYRIKDRFTYFYYKYIFAHISELSIISKEEYYNKYIENDIISFSQDAFRTVCVEYLMLLNKMNKLPYIFREFGTFIGKVGNIDIVAEDKSGRNLIALCNWENDIMTLEDFEWLEFCAKQAKLSDDVYYLFSRTTFDDRLKELANNNNKIYLIDASML